MLALMLSVTITLMSAQAVTQWNCTTLSAAALTFQDAS